MKPKKLTASVKSTTQDFIEIQHVKDDIIVFKDNSATTIISVGATNFGLLSQEEQNGLIYAFSSLLNSLSFPIQILILSKKMDISSYLDYLDSKLKSQHDSNMNKRLLSYKEFVKTLVTKNTILEKKFYCLVPFSPLEMGASSATKTTFNKEYLISRAKTSLYPKRDSLLRLISRAGLQGKALAEQEIIELFYNLYNPSSTGRKIAPLSSYTDIVSTSK